MSDSGFGNSSEIQSEHRDSIRALVIARRDLEMHTSVLLIDAIRDTIRISMHDSIRVAIQREC